ncbi:hypothetical protein SAY86_009800 [Trapa natans]|uniref:Uncharacterized protein n=1 Tax=Trapa natans TaxID=22666 RepID=A0AAN7L4J6_TRANT|nr:hypothetical protein SAY86_009800 [Trapa natans]
MDWAEWILEEPMDQMTADETEDLDYIIALSLAEEGTKLLSSRVKLEEEDEQLAKAIRVSRKSQSHPQCSRANALRTTHLPSTSKDNSASIWKEEPIKKTRGAIWHPDGNGDDHPFHKSCHKEHDDRKCHVCKNFLPRTANGVHLRTNHFWMQKYCPSHEHDGTPICSSCMRLEPRDMPYKVLDAGRRLCSQCLKSAVIYCDTFESLQSNVHEFFRGLDMEVDRQIPIHLVQRTTLNETMEVEKNFQNPRLLERGGSCPHRRSSPDEVVTLVFLILRPPRRRKSSDLFLSTNIILRQEGSAYRKVKA